MKTSCYKQHGFAMPAMFLFVALAFLGSLGVKTPDGTIVATKMGIDLGQKTEFSAVETGPSDGLMTGDSLSLEK
jgi:hypothetical protein